MGEILTLLLWMLFGSKFGAAVQLELQTRAMKVTAQMGLSTALGQLYIQHRLHVIALSSM